MTYITYIGYMYIFYSLITTVLFRIDQFILIVIFFNNY